MSEPSESRIEPRSPCHSLEYVHSLPTALPHALPALVLRGRRCRRQQRASRRGWQIPLGQTWAGDKCCREARVREDGIPPGKYRGRLQAGIQARDHDTGASSTTWSHDFSVAQSIRGGKSSCEHRTDGGTDRIDYCELQEGRIRSRALARESLHRNMPRSLIARRCHLHQEALGRRLEVFNRLLRRRGECFRGNRQLGACREQGGTTMASSSSEKLHLQFQPLQPLPSPQSPP